MRESNRLERYNARETREMSIVAKYKERRNNEMTVEQVLWRFRNFSKLLIPNAISILWSMS